MNRRLAEFIPEADLVDRAVYRRISDEFMERFREACAANPLPEETW